MHKFRYHDEYRSDATHLWLDCTDTNEQGETMLVEIHTCEMDFEHRYGNGYVWKMNGRVDGSFSTWWHIDTYVYQPNGQCFGRYNPQEMTYLSKPDRAGHRQMRPVIDFDWLLEATDENLERILDEIYRRFMAMEPRKQVGDEYFTEQESNIGR